MLQFDHSSPERSSPRSPLRGGRGLARRSPPLSSALLRSSSFAAVPCRQRVFTGDMKGEWGSWPATGACQGGRARRGGGDRPVALRTRLVLGPKTPGASEGLLDTGREGGVEVELGVRVLGDDGVVNSGKDGGHPLGRRRRCGEEGQLLATHLEGAVGAPSRELAEPARLPSWVATGCGATYSRFH